MVELMMGERFSLLAILPKEGDFLTLKTLRELKEMLPPSEEEFEKLEFKKEKDTPGAVRWKPENDLPVELDFSNSMLEIIRNILEALDKNKALKETHFSLYEKFVQRK